MLVDLADFIRNTISFYTLATIIGLLVSFVVLYFLSKRRGITIGQLLYLTVFFLFGVFFGSHILYFLVGLPDFIRTYSGGFGSLADFIDAFLIASSGLVFYGGLLGGLLVLLLACRRFGFPVRETLNMFAVVFPLFHFFGRIGCALTGCCYGIPYSGPLAVYYDASFINPGINDGIDACTRFPVQLLEAVIELIIFVILLLIYIKKEDKYSITCIYLLTYSVVRFFDEFLRGDYIRGFWGPLSTSQWISLFIFIGVIIYLIISQSRSKSELPRES